MSLQVPPIGIVGCTRSFGRNHRGTQRTLRSALFAESRTVFRLLNPPQYQATDTDIRFLGIDFLDLKNSFGIVVSELVAKFITALRDGAHSAPFAIANLENLVYQILGRQVAFPLHNARILILNLPLTTFELLDRHKHSFEDIQGLEAGNDYRHMKPFCDRLVFPIPHYGANVSWSEKSLHPIQR